MPTAERRHRHLAVEGDGRGLELRELLRRSQEVFGQRHTNGVQSETYGTEAAFAIKLEHQSKQGFQKPSRLFVSSLLTTMMTPDTSWGQSYDLAPVQPS